MGRSVGRSLNRRPPMITLQEQGGLVCLACPIHFLATLFWSPRLNRAWSSFEGDRKRRLSAGSLSFPSLFVGSATAHLLTSIMNPRFDIKALSRLVFSSCSSPSSFHILPVVQKCSFQKHLPDGRTAGSGRQVATRHFGAKTNARAQAPVFDALSHMAPYHGRVRRGRAGVIAVSQGYAEIQSPSR